MELQIIVQSKRNQIVEVIKDMDNENKIVDLILTNKQVLIYDYYSSL